MQEGLRVSGLPGGGCEEGQPGTYPSPTTTHLMACIASGPGGSGDGGASSAPGSGEPGRRPAQQQQPDRGRRKRKGNLPKLPSQPFAEGGACGLAEQLGVGALRCWAGPWPPPPPWPPLRPSLLWGTHWRPRDPLSWGLTSTGKARAVLQELEVSKNLVPLNLSNKH